MGVTTITPVVREVKAGRSMIGVHLLFPDGQQRMEFRASIDECLANLPADAGDLWTPSSHFLGGPGVRGGERPLGAHLPPPMLMEAYGVFVYDVGNVYVTLPPPPLLIPAWIFTVDEGNENPSIALYDGIRGTGTFYPYEVWGEEAPIAAYSLANEFLQEGADLILIPWADTEDNSIQLSAAHTRTVLGRTVLNIPPPRFFKALVFSNREELTEIETTVVIPNQIDPSCPATLGET